MTDKVQKIREEVGKRYEYWKEKESNSHSIESEIRMSECGHLLLMLDSLQEEPVSEDLEEAAYYNCIDRLSKESIEDFKAGAQWQKENLWKPADGDDLPIFDREVIVLIKYSTQRNIHEEEYPTYRVGFGHRPNPYGWDGKSVTTGKVEHYTPKTYDKSGWNIPDIVCWLDIELPKEREL